MDRSLVLGIALGLVFAWVWGWTLQYLATQHQNTPATAWRDVLRCVWKSPVAPDPAVPDGTDALVTSIWLRRCELSRPGEFP